jgi:tetratricopeptide (TPR) repeat protein
VRKAIHVLRELGNPVWLAWTLNNLARVLFHQADYAQALSLLQQSQAIAKDLGDLSDSFLKSIWLGNVEMHLGRYERAQSRGKRVLDLCARDLRPGDALLMADQQLKGRMQHILGHARLLLGSVALVRGACADAKALLEESAAALRQEGEHTVLGQALAVLALAARTLGQSSLARQSLREAMDSVIETQGYSKGYYAPRICALLACSLLLIDRGDFERAIELYTLASRYVGNSRWFEDVAGKHIAAAAANLPPEAVAAAQERGRARDLWATAAELLADLRNEWSRR